MDNSPASPPLTREELRQLQRGDRLRDRGGHEWTVRAAAYLDPEVGEHRAALVAGAQVLIERERFCDGYVVLVESTGRPARARRAGGTEGEEERPI